MSDLKWIKLSINMFEDEKIKYLRTLPEGDQLILVWIELLLKAGKKNNHGFIYLTKKMPYNAETLAGEINRPINIVRAALKLFEDLEMIEFMENGYISLINWSKHQTLDKWEKKQIQDAERQRKHRAKLKELAHNANLLEEGKESDENSSLSRDNSVTDNVTVTQCHDTDEDIDKDIDISSSSSSTDSKTLIENLLLTEQFVLPKNASRTIERWLSHDVSVIRLAILEASDNGKINGLGYVTRLLNIWNGKGLNTVEKVQGSIEQWNNRTDLKKTTKKTNEKQVKKDGKYENFYL